MVKWKDSSSQDNYDSTPIKEGYYQLTVSKVRSQTWEIKPYGMGDRILGFDESGAPMFLQEVETMFLACETPNGEEVSLAIENPVGYMGDPSTIALLETLAPGEFKTEEVESWPDQVVTLVGKTFYGFVTANRWVRAYKACVPAGKYKARIHSFGYVSADGPPYPGIRWSKRFESSSRQFPILYRIVEGPFSGAVVFNSFGKYPVRRMQAGDEVWLTSGNLKTKAHQLWQDFCQVQLGLDMDELGASGVFDFVEKDDNPYPNLLPALYQHKLDVPLIVSIGSKGYIDNLMPDFGGTQARSIYTPRQKIFQAVNKIGQEIYGKDILSLEGEQLFVQGLLDIASSLLGPLCDSVDYFDRTTFLRGGTWDDPSVADPMVKILSDPRAIEALTAEEPDIEWAIDIATKVDTDETSSAI